MITALIKFEVRRLFLRRSAYLIALGGVAVLGLVTSVITAHVLLGAYHVPFTLGAGAGWLLAGYALIVAIAGAIGVAVGLIIRSQLWSVLALVVWMTMLEASVVHFFPAVGRWLPGGADAAIVSDATVHQRLPVVAGLAVLMAWAARAALAWQRRLYPTQ